MKDKMVQQKVGGLRRLDLWWESLPSMQPIIFVSGSSSAAASSSFSGDVGSSSSASSAESLGTSALGAGVSTKKRMRSDQDKGEMQRLSICFSDKLGGGSDVYMKTCFVGRSNVGDKGWRRCSSTHCLHSLRDFEVNRGLPLPALLHCYNCLYH
jgi:hypothetical protein